MNRLVVLRLLRTRQTIQRLTWQRRAEVIRQQLAEQRRAA